MDEERRTLSDDEILTVHEPPTRAPQAMTADPDQDDPGDDTDDTDADDPDTGPVDAGS